MAISVHWGTKVITVPRADMTLVQSTPIEIRELNINEFRLRLKDLEDDEEGMPFLDTHSHNTEVLLGGIVYARVVEIINGYTVTFEDGAYAVNLVGANSNIGDVINFNQVSVRSSNSGGLISNSAIEYSSFQNAVWIDATSTTTGTTFPAGTPQQPVNNLDDAKLIAEFRGIETFQIVGNFNFVAGDDVSNYIILGQNAYKSAIFIHPDATVSNCEIREAFVSGALDDGAIIRNGIIQDLDYVNGVVFQTLIQPGTIVLGSGSAAFFLDCYSGVGATAPNIDFGGSGQTLVMRNYSGEIQLSNKTGPDVASIDLASGKITIDSDVTAGTLTLRGIGTLVDDSVGATIEADDLLNKDNISSAVWDEPIGDHLISGSTGYSVGLAEYAGKITIDTTYGVSGSVFPIGTERTPVNNLVDALTIAAERGIETLNIDSNFTIRSGDNISGYNVNSDNHATLTIDPGAFNMYTSFTALNMSGTLGGYSVIENCSTDANGLNEFYGIMDRCTFNGPLSVSSNSSTNAIFIDCFTGNVPGPPDIDCNGDGAKISMRGLTGAAKFVNKTGATQKIFIDLNSARIGFDSTIETGSIAVRGVGYIYLDESVSASFDTQGLISQPTIAQAVWDEQIGDHLIGGTTGFSVGIQQYAGAVHIDTTSSNTGSEFPIGTDRVPVNNLADAVTIATSRGIDELHFISDYTFDNTVSISNFTLRGDGPLDTTFTFQAGCVVAYCEIREATATGNLTGVTGFYKSIITDLGSVGLVPSSQDIFIENCLFGGTITLPSNYSGDVKIIDCYSNIPGSGRPIFDHGNSTCNIFFRNYTGGMELQNITENISATVDLVSGNCVVDSSVTNGDIVIRGVGKFTDNSTGSAVVSTDGLISQPTVAQAVWDEPISDHLTVNTFGHQQYHQAYAEQVVVDTISGSAGTLYPLGTHEFPVDNLDDALYIANLHGFQNIHINGHLNISASQDVSGLTVLAERSLGNSCTVESGAITDGTYFQDLTVNGTMGGSVRYTTCVLGEIFNFDGGAKNSLLTNDIHITGNGANYFTECDTYVTDPTQPKEISIGDNLLNLIRCRGAYKLTDKTSTSTTAVDLVAGTINVDSTCASGSIFIGGIAEVVDNSSAGCVVNVRALSKDVIADGVWDELLAEHTITGSAGYSLANVSAGSNPNDIAEAVWNRTPAQVVTGSLGESLLHTLGLAQNNFRMNGHVYDGSGNLTSSVVKLYASSGDADAGTNEIAEFNMTAVYDGNNRLTDYKVTKA